MFARPRNPARKAHSRAAFVAAPILAAAIAAPLLSAQADDYRPSRFYPDRFSDGGYCLPAVEKQLVKLGVPTDSVESVYFERREQRDSLRRGGVRRIVGYDAWVRPKDTKGYLVLQLFVNCSLQQAYTRGEYQVAGVPAY